MKDITKPERPVKELLSIYIRTRIIYYIQSNIREYEFVRIYILFLFFIRALVSKLNILNIFV